MSESTEDLAERIFIELIGQQGAAEATADVAFFFARAFKLVSRFQDAGGKRGDQENDIDYSRRMRRWGETGDDKFLKPPKPYKEGGL